MKPILRKTLPSLFIAFFAVIVFLYYFYIRIPQKINGELASQEYYGRVASLSYPDSCYLKIMLTTGSSDTSLFVSKCCGPKFDSFFDYLAVGDSLVKRKGSLEISILKPSPSVPQSFPFPFCFK